MSRQARSFNPIDRLALCIGRAVLAFLGFATFWLTAGKLLKRYARIPAPAFFGFVLDSPWRRAIQPPELVLAPMHIAPGMTVLELGPGPGTFTTAAAARTLPGGRVIAVDVQEDMLAQLRRKAERAGLTNIETYVADAYSLPVTDASVDVAFMVGVLAEIRDPLRALGEVRRVLRPGGLVAISEVFPDPDYPRPATTRRWLAGAGFEAASLDGHRIWYVMTARKPAAEVAS